MLIAYQLYQVVVALLYIILTVPPAAIDDGNVAAAVTAWFNATDQCRLVTICVELNSNNCPL